MNYIYHLATVQHSAGKRRILALVVDRRQKKQPSKDCAQTFLQKQETPRDKITLR